MTTYEILTIVSPILTIILGGMMTHIFKNITASISRLDSRIDKIDDRLGLVEKDLYFIKGLIEGKNLPR